MVKKYIITISTVCFIAMASVAQKKQEKKFIFSSRVSVGLLEGEFNNALQLQTIQGWNGGKWFMGMGAGLDYYMFRSVPLFLSFKRDLKPGNRGFFAQADIGLNAPWARNPWIDEAGHDLNGGLYWQGGLGYAANLGSKKNQLMINLGYSYKHLTELTQTTVFCINPPCPSIVEKYNYHLRRLSLAIGWHFISY